MFLKVFLTITCTILCYGSHVLSDEVKDSKKPALGDEAKGSKKPDQNADNKNVDQGKNPSATGKTSSAAKTSVTQKQRRARKKRGGELYTEYSGVMHRPRLKSELTPAQWTTTLLFHRVKIPLTPADQRDMEAVLAGK